MNVKYDDKGKTNTTLPEHFRQHAIREKNNYELIESFYHNIEQYETMATEGESEISLNIRQFSLSMRDMMFNLTAVSYTHLTLPTNREV